MNFRILIFFILCFFRGFVFASEQTVIRLGILPFGTVNWEITTLQDQLPAKSRNFQLHIRHIANPQAGKIALQSGAVDIIVADWIWVSRQRSMGTELSFYPYSNTAGALMVPPGSAIHSVQDLKEISLGIAGGELDKNWLLLQALALQKYKFDLNQSVEKVYAAPPLLNQEIRQGRADAIINYWHFAARLEAEGYRQIINGAGILKDLGIKQKVPSLGYVFNRQWAENHRQAINSFLLRTQQARTLLCTSDNVWQKIIPLTKTKKVDTQQILRRRYCQGRVELWGEAERQAAEKIYQLLKKLSHSRLTGTSKAIQAGTFWVIN